MSDRITPDKPLVEDHGPHLEGSTRVHRRTTYAALSPAHAILGDSNDRITVWSDSTHGGDRPRPRDAGSITIYIDEHGSPTRGLDVGLQEGDREPASAVIVLNEVEDMVAVRDALTTAIDAIRAHPAAMSS